MARVWWMAVLAGCPFGPIDAEVDYAKALAEAECDRMQRCELGYFDATYPSVKDCVHDVSDEIGAADDALQQSQCDYQPDEAGRCVRRVRSMSCEDFAEGDQGDACDLVWDCSDGVYAPPTYTRTYYGR
jgi:hypothetical protein